MSVLSDFAVKHVIPLLQKIAPDLIDRLAVNIAVGAEKDKRPHPFSLWTGMGDPLPPTGDTADTAKPIAPLAPGANKMVAATASAFSPSGYVSWPGLADRRYTGRHLPPADDTHVASLPDREEVVRTLLIRRPGTFTKCNSTSTLFCFFAQWFTDSFLRTDPQDRRRNTSNHEIDFCQLYGLDERTTLALRERQGGRLRLDHGLLPKLADTTGLVRPEFGDLSYIRPDDAPAGTVQSEEDRRKLGDRLRAALGKSLGQPLDDARWAHMYASGLERGNSTILYTALSTMCAREHNRVASELAKLPGNWDDDRVFETARIVMIRNILKIVVEDYINHLAGGFNFKLDRHFAEHETWYRSNRISLEFNLLYRWHSLVPETFAVDDAVYGHQAYRFDNAILEKHGVEHCINAASTQHAGRIQLYNTPEFLWRAEMASLDMARTFGLQPFVAYCDRFNHKPPESFKELTRGDERAAADLERLYTSVDRVELPIGLIAEGREDDDAVLPPLVRTMVAVDAFTHIFTNPLLSNQVHEAAFQGPASAVGELTHDTGGIVGLMHRAQAEGTDLLPSFSVREKRPND